MRAVIYSRISGEDQSVYSLDSQVEECKKEINHKSHELVEIYTENGYSAKNMNRPSLQRMFADLAAKKFDIIYIWRLDRLTRDTLDGLNMVVNIFRPNGVEFASVTEDINTSTSDGYMMFTIRLSMAQAEREKIRERTTGGLRKRAMAGKRTSAQRPYGYNINEMQLTVNEVEAEIVRRIYTMYAAGNGYLKIADTLNGDGVPSRDEKGWTELILNKMLGNLNHIGANHWKRKEDPESERIVTLNTHEPIVPIELFETVVSIKERKREGHMSKSSHEFCFSVVVKCGLCGQSFHGKTKTGSTLKNYRCSGNTRDIKCGSSDISETKLTKLFLDYISKQSFTMVIPDKVIGGRDTVKDRKKLEKNLTDSELKKERYTKGMGAGAIEFDKFLQLMAEEADKQKVWQAELDELNMQTPSHKKHHSDIARAFEDININWHSNSEMEKKLIISKLFKYIIIKKEIGVWKVAAVSLY